jgi:uncharacterized membrane protein YfcA
MGEIIIGIVSGMVAALGMGGGTILILLLGIFTELKQHIIQGSNLIFFIPTSIVAIIMNVKNKTINYKNALVIIISGIIGAVIGCEISFNIENKKLKKIFGIFLLCIAIFEIYDFFRQYIKSKKENNN